ncbi:hypothetical protein TNCV_966921 [Trichonephila clavipes]|nr:hypothetical protein TNCV_966921 [Trichonephila clavipes]
MNNSVREGDAPPFSKTSFNLCREVGTHRRKFRLCRGRNHNFNYITCEEVKSVESKFFLHWIHRTCEQQGSQKKRCSHACVHFNSNVSVSNVIENSSYDLPYVVENFNTGNDSSSLIKDYKCNYCVEEAVVPMKTSSVEFISQSPTPSPMNSNYRRFCVTPTNLSALAVETRGKERNRFRTDVRTLQRKISMRSTKINLLKRCSYAGETQCFPGGTFRMSKGVPSHDGETV